MTDLTDRVYEIMFRQTKPSESANFRVAVDDIGVSIKQPIAMSFSAEKTTKKEPNTLDLKVYNLAPRTRAELQREGVVLRFSAGYKSGGPRLLFIGDVKYANSERKGTEWITEIQVGDGSRAFAHARANQSFKSGTNVLTVLQFVAQSMSITVPVDIAVTKTLQTQFFAGYAMSGKSRDELTRLLAPYGYSWSIQNGVLRVLRDEETTAGQTREISQNTGMIGSPEFGKPEKGKPPKRTVYVQLYPELLPGEKVNIISRTLEGVHKIEKVKHTGDTQTDEWKTQVEVTAIK